MNNGPDNKDVVVATIIIGDEKPGSNLRHKLNSNDLESLCQKQKEEINELKIKNETMSSELQELSKNSRQAFSETIGKIKEQDSELSIQLVIIISLIFLYFFL